ncbi:MAG TPA: 2Fe-2S iron-sulfur cluster-binding protein [Gammaproteobacteria bacterium]|nr:2Fe-2S iron-sulfur cluster-binding protein [Gammaproteobacteria bacterium]
MARRISLSRAARLVGVKRGVLQQQIRAGLLQTFEGEIVLADLLHAYPNAQIEDSSMLDRVAQIIEQASFINTDTATRKPDNLALGTRVMALGKDLSQQQRLVSGYRKLLRELRMEIDRLADNSAAPHPLGQWLDEAEATLAADGDTIDQPLINETFLRVMTAQATVIPSGHEFFVEGADSILEAGLRGGLALNYGCSNGNCGLCKMRVVSGDTRKIRHHDYALTEAEKGLGYILGCSHTAVSDVVLEADEAQGSADIPKQTIPLRLKRIERPSADVLIVSTRTPRTNRLRFLAGQRATLSVDQVGSALYPIASCPCDDMNLQFHIALNPGDAVAKYLAEAASTNDTLMLEGPNGSFVLDENSPRALVFIAEGIGFASIKGLIEHAMALDTAEQIYLFWITDDDAPPYLNNLCRSWNDALDNFAYQPLPASALQNLAGHLDTQLQPAAASGLDFYICARESLREQCEQYAERQAIPARQLLFETI